MKTVIQVTETHEPQGIRRLAIKLRRRISKNGSSLLLQSGVSVFPRSPTRGLERETYLPGNRSGDATQPPNNDTRDHKTATPVLKQQSHKIGITLNVFPSVK